MLLVLVLALFVIAYLVVAWVSRKLITALVNHMLNRRVDVTGECPLCAGESEGKTPPASTLGVDKPEDR